MAQSLLISFGCPSGDLPIFNQEQPTKTSLNE
jgi:hypothetical protein